VYTYALEAGMCVNFVEGLREAALLALFDLTGGWDTGGLILGSLLVVMGWNTGSAALALRVFTTPAPALALAAGPEEGPPFGVGPRELEATELNGLLVLVAPLAGGGVG
jgi:hypothetical protein